MPEGIGCPSGAQSSMAQLEERSPTMEEEAPVPQTQLTTVPEEARPVSVGSSQAPTADDGFFEETRARGLAALREATAYLRTTPTKATPRQEPAAVVAADDALQQLASADEAERAYAAFSASLELPGARDAFADLLNREQAEEVLCSALANLSAAEATSKPLAKAARKLLRHPTGTVRADAARYLGGFVDVIDDKAREGLTQLARLDPDANVRKESTWALQRLGRDEVEEDAPAADEPPEALPQHEVIQAASPREAPADLDDADEVLRRSDELIARLMREASESKKKKGNPKPKPSPVRRRNRRSRRRVLEVSEDDSARGRARLPTLPRGASA